MLSRFKIITAILLITMSIPGYARDDHDEAKRLLESGEILPLEIILNKAREIQPGKVLEVEFETKKGKKIYEIEILSTNGTVFELKLDARTGKFISSKKED